MSKVASGQYATESEVIRDRLRALQARDAALQKWLQDEVVQSYDEFAANPAIGIPAEDVMGRLRTAYKERISKLEK
jgi:antitoxin ParD1/3/4